MPEQSSEEIIPDIPTGKEKMEPITPATSHENTPAQASESGTLPPPDLPAALPQERLALTYSDEDILNGRVYPPPPTFYQKQPARAEEPVHHQVPPPRYVPEAARAVTGYLPPTKPYAAAGTLPPSPPLPVPPATRQGVPGKRSRTWIWVVVAIMATAIIASVSLCGWAGYSLFSNMFQEALGAQNTVNDFYSDLQTQNYTQAYSYLDLQGTQHALTKQQFVQQALEQDVQSGPLLSYTPNQPEFGTDSSQGTDINQSTITIKVGRKLKEYTAKLTMRREGNSWKITSYDRL